MKLIFETEEDLLKYASRLDSYIEMATTSRFPFIPGDYDKFLEEAISILKVWGRQNFKNYASSHFLEYFDNNRIVENFENKEAIKKALNKLTKEEKKLLGLNAGI